MNCVKYNEIQWNVIYYLVTYTCQIKVKYVSLLIKRIIILDQMESVGVVLEILFD